MKKTKTVLFTAFITLAAFGTAMYTSCKKNPCSGVSCLNGGTCNGGNCSCQSGYSGSNCGTAASAAFTGNWSGYVTGGYGGIPLNQIVNVSVTNTASAPFKLSITGSVNSLLSMGAVGMPNNDTTVVFTGIIESNDVTYFNLNSATFTDALGDANLVSGYGFIKGD